MLVNDNVHSFEIIVYQIGITFLKWITHFCKIMLITQTTHSCAVDLSKPQYHLTLDKFEFEYDSNYERK